MENLSLFAGRFHPLLVHLPIGILILAFLFELLSRSKRYKKLRVAVRPALFWGALSALASAGSGYLLSQEGGYDDSTLNLHQNFGLATSIFTLILYIFQTQSKAWFPEKKKRKIIQLSLFFALIILLMATGHLGGSLTHGEDFLTEFATLSPPKESVDPGIAIQAIANVEEALLYPAVVEPILRSRCYSCHSSKKQKGELRLDEIDLIRRGGKHGEVIEAGNADSSRMYSRLMLPLEDEHHMPPNEKPQLSSSEIDLIQVWINEGASFEKKVKEFAASKKISQSIRLIAESAVQHSWLPREDVLPASEKIIQELRSTGVIVLPVGTGNHYLTASYVNVATLDEKDLERLLTIKDQLVSLRLSSHTIRDQDIRTLSKLNRLSWLYLDHTSITDSAAIEISKLEKLQYLNLVGTSITDQSLILLGSLKELKYLYCYGTKVTSTGINALRKRLPSLEIDSGNYTLPILEGDTVIYRSKG